MDKHLKELDRLKDFMKNKIDLICSNEEYYEKGSLSRLWLPEFNQNKNFGKQEFKQLKRINVKLPHGIPDIKIEVTYRWAEYLCTRFNTTTSIAIIKT